MDIYYSDSNYLKEIFLNNKRTMNESIKTQISQVINGLFLYSLPPKRSTLTGFILTREGELFERQTCDLQWERITSSSSFLFTDTDNNLTLQVKNSKIMCFSETPNENFPKDKFYLSMKDGQFGLLLTGVSTVTSFTSVTSVTSVTDWKILTQMGNWTRVTQGGVTVPKDGDYRINVNLSYMAIIPNRPKSLAMILNFSTVKLSSSEVVIPRNYVPRFVILVNNVVQHEALLSANVITICNSPVLPFRSINLNEIGQVSMNIILNLQTNDIVQIAYIDNPSTVTQGYIVSNGQLQNIREVQVPELITVNPDDANQSRFILNPKSSTFSIELINRI